jgi:hypothetical protein
MDLEETLLPAVGEDCGEMLMLEAGAGESGDRMRRKAEAIRSS